MAEEHRTILVEQLHDIVTQLANNPDQLPTVSFPPEECFSPTRDKRDPSSEAAKTEHQPPAEPQHQPHEPSQAVPPPVRGTEKPPEKVKRFQISPVVENKPIVPIVPTSFPTVIPGSSMVSVDKRDNSTITVAGTKIDTATSPTTLAFVEKLEMSRPMTMPDSSGLTATMSPGAEQQQVMSASNHSQAQVSPGSTIGTSVTSPDVSGAPAPSHHPLTVVTHASRDVSDLEANLAMVFNTKIPAPSLPSAAASLPTSNVPGIVPLGVSTEQPGLAVPPQQPQQAEASTEHLSVASETDQGLSNSSTVHSTKSSLDDLGEPVKQSTPIVTPDKAHEVATPNSRFAVKRVEDITVSSGPSIVSEEPELTAINIRPGLMGPAMAATYQRVAAEAEHYDSSPSPGSCYDTASESVEPIMMGPGHGPSGPPQISAVTQTPR